MKNFNVSNKILAALISGSMILLSATACNKTSPLSSEESTKEVQKTEESSVITSETAFSDKDLEVGYDESDAQTITLTGDSAVSDSSSVKISGPVITITGKGTYVITGTLNDGYIVVDAGDSDDVRIVLKNADITSSDYAAIYCLNADNVYITLEEGTSNSLVNEGEYDSKDSNKVDGAVFAKTDLTINGSGSLSVTSSAHGIVGKDDISISGGNITVNSGKDGIQANDAVAVQNATLDITCGKDGIQSDNDDDPSKSYIYISSGSITIAAGDDAITTAASIQIDDGTINITGSYEGIEGQNITINGGKISIVSSDDAVNAVSDSSGDTMRSDGVSTLTINDGDIYIRSEGDGIDSNGTFEMTGGILTVMGPTRGGNGSLDVNGNAVITGGTVVMAGSSDMATNFTEASQGAVLINTGNQSEGTLIAVIDSTGKEIISVTASCSYQSVLISSPEMVSGKSYTVTAGNFSETITLSDNIYGGGSGFGGHGGGMPGGDPQGGGFPGGRPDDDRGRQRPG
ncbi:MAG: carbohydrate-binding domain-containing protein [Clostridiales bacterium]|nr:carbohydrate-binding domain-containing protein [Clostridiales bacterium]